MLLIVNSTKTMDLERPVPPRLRPGEPAFAAEAAGLVARLRGLGAARLARAVGASGALADAARADLARWGAPGRPRRPALYAFTGLVYQGLAPEAGCRPAPPGPAGPGHPLGALRGAAAAGPGGGLPAGDGQRPGGARGRAWRPTGGPASPPPSTPACGTGSPC